MTEFLKRLLFFLFFSVIGYLILIIVWGELVPAAFQKNLSYRINGNGHLNTRLNEVKGYKDVDVLFLGSSRSYRHYDPKIFAKKGYSSFNLGSSSQTFLQTEVLLKRYLRDLNPKLIVLDIYPGMFNSDGVESSIDLISNDDVDLQIFNMMFLQKNIKVFNTLIFSCYRGWVFKNNNEIEKIKKGDDTYVSGGYVNKKFRQSSKIVSDTLIDFNMRGYQVDAFLSIINLIREEGKEVIIVQSPKQKGIIYNREFRMDSLFNSKNIKYINYSNLCTIDDYKDFYHPMHLNENGVEIYNNIIIDEILNKLGF